MSLRGKLIVLEGPDGVGKSTLARGLVHELSKRSVSVIYRSFPGRQRGSLGRLVYGLHHDAQRYDVEHVDAASLQLLHVAAHLDSIDRDINPALRRGQWVVLDRYWWSTWVYGRATQVNESLLDSMIRVELECWADTRPALCFLIARESPFRAEFPPPTWARLTDLYHELSDREATRYPVTCVQNARPLAQVIDELVQEVSRRLMPSAKPAQQDTDVDVTQRDAADATIANREESADGRRAGGERAPISFTRLSPAVPTPVFDTLWRFAVERQEIFFKRLRGAPPPWTQDAILGRYKFTNAYRASDRVSQFAIRHVIYAGDQSPNEVFFRTILFKVFNRIETWELLRSRIGAIAFCDFSYERYDRILTEALREGHKIFSPAYIMPSGGSAAERGRKHSSFLLLLERMMRDEVPKRITEMRRMRDAFELLKSYPMLGDFLAYQYVIDLNYGPIADWSEMEFVVAGPGAKSGIKKCFASLAGLTEADTIRLVADQQEAHFERLGLGFKSLWGRRLQLIDCQNLFCEVDKYARVAHPDMTGSGGRARIKQVYRTNPTPIEYWYPPKWRLNDHARIQGGRNESGDLWPDSE